MKNKLKQIYNIIFAVISLLPFVWLGWALFDLYQFVATAPDQGDIRVKLPLYLGPPMYCMHAACALCTILFLYSGLKYFLFAPEKKPLKIIWNVTKLIFAVVAFLPIVDAYIYPIYWTLLLGLL